MPIFRPTHHDPQDHQDAEAVSKLLAEVTRAMRATMRTEAPHPDEVQHWIEIHNTKTGRITWMRRDLYDEWNRLHLKLRGIDKPDEAVEPC